MSNLENAEQLTDEQLAAFIHKAVEEINGLIGEAVHRGLCVEIDHTVFRQVDPPVPFPVYRAHISKSL